MRANQYKTHKPYCIILEDFKTGQQAPNEFFIEVLIKKMKRNHCKMSVKKHFISSRCTDEAENSHFYR